MEDASKYNKAPETRRQRFELHLRHIYFRKYNIFSVVLWQAYQHQKLSASS